MNSLLAKNYIRIFSLIFLLFLILIPRPTFVNAHKSENERVVIIHIDENGFEPRKIDIPQKTEVVFENVGKDDHWPASDNHPTHTLYDDTSLEKHCGEQNSTTFDSCGPISAGNTWPFVFEKPGTFSYHDHLWPHLNGEIIVRDAVDDTTESKNLFFRLRDFFRKIFLKVYGFFISTDESLVLNSGNTNSELYEKLKVRYKSIVLESDAREAMQALQQESAQNSKVSALCHDILHEIGHTAFNKYGNFKEAVKFQSDFCNSGYIHGIFESYFKSTEKPLSGLTEQCNEYASFGGRQFDLWQCHHGIGHGLMYLTGGDLNESLALCERGLGKEAGASCQNGAFMEVFNLEVLAKENDYIDPENPFLTCSTRNVAKSDCYLYLPTYLSQTKGVDFSDIFEECDKAEFGYKSSCIHGVGSEAIKRNMNAPDTVFALCRQAGSVMNQELCVAGAVGMYMNQKGSHSAGEKFCEQAPQDFSNVCKRVVNNRESFF